MDSLERDFFKYGSWSDWVRMMTVTNSATRMIASFCISILGYDKVCIQYLCHWEFCTYGTVGRLFMSVFIFLMNDNGHKPASPTNTTAIRPCPPPLGCTHAWF